MKKNLILGLMLVFSVVACDDEGEGTASIDISSNETGEFDVDFTGDGGSVTESFTWNNPAGYYGTAAAEYSMDITASSGSEVNVVVLDADGEEVADFGLTAGQGDDSLDGKTLSGPGGEWTVTIELINFSGDGSLNFDGGDPDEI